MQELPAYVKRVNSDLKRNRDVQKAGDKIGFSPLCGTIITDMAIAALHGEKLGKGKYPDMLCISYSQTDVIGHEWGTRGEHTDAAYLQLDKDLARLFRALDGQVGAGNYIVFLTADHGAAHSWRFMQEHKLPAGPFYGGEFKNALDEHLSQKLGLTKSVIGDIMDYRIFLNRQVMEGFTPQQEQQVRETIVNFAHSYPHLVGAYDYEKVRTSALPQRMAEQILRGYFPGRAGDIITIPEPQYYGSWQGAPEGQTTHGEWNPYDAHIPCLFMGWHVPHGATSREVHITDIAPTICQLLHIQQPNCCIGEAITEITK